MVVLTILPSFVVVFQSPSRVWLFTTPRTVAHQASMSFIISWSLLRLMSLSWWCDPTISSSVTPFSFCPQSFPPSGPFLMSQLFASRGQSTGASASILPMNIQNWFALGLTGLISLQSEGLSRVFSNITVASQKASVYTHTHIFRAWRRKSKLLLQNQMTGSRLGLVVRGFGLWIWPQLLSTCFPDLTPQSFLKFVF